MFTMLVFNILTRSVTVRYGATRASLRMKYALCTYSLSWLVNSQHKILATRVACLCVVASVLWFRSCSLSVKCANKRRKRNGFYAVALAAAMCVCGNDGEMVRGGDSNVRCTKLHSPCDAEVCDIFALVADIYSQHTFATTLYFTTTTKAAAVEGRHAYVIVYVLSRNACPGMRVINIEKYRPFSGQPHFVFRSRFSGERRFRSDVFC